jgi:hypothetical protein
MAVALLLALGLSSATAGVDRTGMTNVLGNADFEAGAQPGQRSIVPGWLVGDDGVEDGLVTSINGAVSIDDGDFGDMPFVVGTINSGYLLPAPIEGGSAVYINGSPADDGIIHIYQQCLLSPEEIAAANSGWLLAYAEAYVTGNQVSDPTIQDIGWLRLAFLDSSDKVLGIVGGPGETYSAATPGLGAFELKTIADGLSVPAGTESLIFTLGGSLDTVGVGVQAGADDAFLSLTIVPEPATLVVIACVSALLVRRRR